MSLREKYSASNPAYRVRPSLRFVYSHPAHMIALFFGAGCLRPGPGTWGSLFGLLTWIALVGWIPLIGLIALIAAGVVLGAWASQVTSDHLGVEDAGCIVIDEVVAVWLVAVCFPQTPLMWILSILTFRLFDIVKLPPAAWADRKLKNGWGIMVDDLFAAVWAILTTYSVQWFLLGMGWI